jgi:Xaa-Pro dipeptidase
MTHGVGGTSREAALARMSNMTNGVVPISEAEYRSRIARAQSLMREQGIAAIYAHAGTNLTYFTGTRWRPSERLVGALLPAQGQFQYLAPYFEVGSLRDFSVLEAPINAWHEHESPYRLFLETLMRMGISGAGARIGMCESAPFFVVDGIRKLDPSFELVNAATVTAPCRMRKSPNELALIHRAHTMTLEVHRAAASTLREGITTTDVEAFIDAAHRQVGAAGSYFCIVLFGKATAFPHGVRHPQVLEAGDMVLIDTGCLVESYMSDITRSYVFGSPSDRQRAVWNSEKAAQAAAFQAARLGATCESVDAAARLRSRLSITRSAASNRPRHRARHPRMAISGRWRPYCPGHRHVLQQRTDDLCTRRIWCSARRSLLHDRDRPEVVHRAELLDRRPLRRCPLRRGRLTIASRRPATPEAQDRVSLA